MRRRIESTVLKERFEKAWAILPVSERERLRSFIRYVDEVEVLEGTYVYGVREAGKGVERIMGPLEVGTGYTAFMTLGSKDVADVILPSDPLASYDEAAALAIILHELAHAVDYLNYPNEAIKRSWYRSEVHAWTQVIAWSRSSTLISDGSNDEVRMYARLAMLGDSLRIPCE